MQARTRFIAAVLADEDSITALCEEYRVSRRIAYKWLARYQAEGPAGLVDRSRAPHVVPWEISQAHREAFVAMRGANPAKCINFTAARRSRAAVLGGVPGNASLQSKNRSSQLVGSLLERLSCHYDQRTARQPS